MLEQLLNNLKPQTLTTAPITVFEGFSEHTPFAIDNTHDNALLNAAAPIFAAASRLRLLQRLPDINLLQQQLRQNLQTFVENTHLPQYHPQVVAAAREALAHLLDDIISKTSWGQQGQWQHRVLQTMEQKDLLNIIECSLQDPHMHADLLELFYTCLSLNADETSHLRQRIYQKIQHVRDDFSRTLLIRAKQTTAPQKPARLILRTFLTLFLTALLMIVAYIGMQYYLHIQIQKASQAMLQSVYSEQHSSAKNEPGSDT